ncbi:unnamed protein product [Plutella xylostella]|uniref:(diamondback moth) hypothetical protein n=1 Tax=Plutella xylostella TaxID=51655 RepID=A0A8S4G747_PLUXY|nr:unnamed protein product [Plutella xylostella]
MDAYTFTINGEPHSVGADAAPGLSLLEYIRGAGLPGTKRMCEQGGCGACTVAVSLPHRDPGDPPVMAVNSCLVSAVAAAAGGWAVRTAEGVGRRASPHELQRRLADYHGSQCGYCTPGWVTAMYSLYESEKPLTEESVEESFGGNLCRCTGYRPILAAFRTFATAPGATQPGATAPGAAAPGAAQCGAGERCSGDIQDVEELPRSRCASGCSSAGSEWSVLSAPRAPAPAPDPAGAWHVAHTLQDVFAALRTCGFKNYRLVNGNTGKGVYPSLAQAVTYIDISGVRALRREVRDENLVLGAGLSLRRLRARLAAAASDPDFTYLQHFVEHLKLVATVQVRNIGTIGGNLAMKNEYKEFQSDIFVLLATVKATVTIMDSDMTETDVPVVDFLNMDLSGKLITEVKLPPLSASHVIRTYKIMPRAQNSHAIVNAGFMFKLDESGAVEASSLVFGGVAPGFVHAAGAEAALRGRALAGGGALRGALAALARDLQPDHRPPEPAPHCRKSIALGLFYRAVLSVVGAEAVSPRLRSGAAAARRPLSRGTQTYDTDKTVWPLNQPVPKLEALAQCTGEAAYVDDAAAGAREAHLAPVLATAVADRVHIDATDALAMPGVLAVLAAADIPGSNSFTPTSVVWQQEDEPVLAQRAQYHGQVVALVAATDRRLALAAAARVKVTYSNVKDKPVITIQDALAAPDAKERIREDIVIEPTDRGTDVARIIKGSFTVPSQYHFTMETQTARAAVSEDGAGVDVASSSQWLHLVQVAVARMLKLRDNQVNVSAARVGGGYGGKASRAALPACLAALAASRLRRPARLVLTLEDNMRAIGKRQECRAEFEVGVSAAGLVQHCSVQYHSDCGCSFNDAAGAAVATTMTSLVDARRWRVRGCSVRTDTPSATWCRAPGTTEAFAIVDHIMERIAFALELDSTDVKLLNLSPRHGALRDMVLALKADAQYDQRMAEINKFNAENAWKKRALKLALMAFPIEYSGNFAAMLSVYHADGSVAVAHAGVELGQGVHTKAAQVVAYTLKIPLDLVTVKPTNNFVTPNAMVTNGSYTSEAVCHAAVKACQELLARLEPVRKELEGAGGGEPTWQELVQKAYEKGINLNASYMSSDNEGLVGYSVRGAALVQLELDALAGTHQLARADLVQDTGRCLSPAVDVGQIEGAFTMGLGLWTSERLAYSGAGRLLTAGTWWYLPPGARDIPADLRVTLKQGQDERPVGVLRSKATGEPALVLAVAAAHALLAAAAAARREHHPHDTDWKHVEAPYTEERVMEVIDPDPARYTLQ